MADAGTEKTLIRKWFARTVSASATIMVLGLAAGFVWQGSALIADRANAVAPPEPTEPIKVSTSRIAMQNHYTVARAFTGQVEAPQTVSIAFEMSGTVKSVWPDEGHRVAEGDLLAELDDRLLRADLERLIAARGALLAQKELAVLTDQRQAELKKKGFASGQAADQSRLSVLEITARIAEMDAAILSAEIQLEKATIRAPFSGLVERRSVDPGTAVGNGQAILTMVEDDAPVFRVGISPALADAVYVGMPITVELNSVNVPAEVMAVLPTVDPLTRTRIVRARLLEAGNIAFGQTGQFTLDEQIASNGAWIPLGAIEDGVRGLWTIKTVGTDERPIVSIEAVEILHADEERAFVRGTFDPDDRLIVSGLHRVVAGQFVRVEK